MEKSLFEHMGGTYSKLGDYYLPNLIPPESTDCEIGRFGRAHLKYIKEHKRVLYTDLLTSGKLNACLHAIDEQALDMLETLVKQMAKQEGITEQLKATDQMAWVGAMNNIRNAVTEIVNTEFIYC
jgi:hypothetical protein